jgi:NADPH:quinone reductase-like Zn-dependent oxidoreductase
MLARPPGKRDLVAVKELLETGEVTPVIDRCYTLSEVPEALRYIGQGHARGKVIIITPTTNPSNTPFGG